MVEAGRELLGVAVGVPLGVDEALSTPTRDFLEDERGVMLLLRKGLTGVASSRAVLLTLAVLPLLVRAVRLLCELFAEAVVGATASRGVRGVFAVRLLASVGFSGLGLLGWGRSIGILHGVLDYCGWEMRWMRRLLMAIRSGNGAVAGGRGVDGGC